MMIKKHYSIFLVVFVLITFGCQNATSDKEKNKTKADDQQSFEKIITSTLDKNTYKEESPLKPWSNYYLWTSFVKTKSYATFTLKNSNKLPPLEFKIVGKLIKDPSIRPDYEYFLPYYVDIYDLSKSKLLQKINAKNKFDNDIWGWDNIGLPYLQIVDVNFDGYPDLRFLSSWGATGNEWYATYIYNPALHKFVFNKILSRLCSVSIDPKTKQISSYYHGGACAEYWDYYKFVNNKLVLIKSQWTEIDRSRDNECNGFGCFIYTGIPRSKPIKLNPKKNHGNIPMRETMKIIKEEPSCN